MINRHKNTFYFLKMLIIPDKFSRFGKLQSSKTN